MIPVPLIAFPIALLAALLLSGGTGYWGYAHGIAIQEARQTRAELVQSRKDLDDYKKAAQKANDAGQKFEEAKPQIIREVRERTQYVNIPPDADPVLPVWFVRMFDRLASADPRADSYPGEPDSAPSRSRLSGVKPVLERWVDKYETCRRAVAEVHELNPVMPAPVEQPTFVERLFD